MGFVSEFKDFAMKGNVVDLAVGVVIGDAFGKVVGSLVNDVIMPTIGAIFGNPNFFSTWVIAGFPFGKFLQAIVNFLIVAFALFIFIKALNATKKAEPPAPPAEPSSTDKLLMEIRDNLKR
jgi:large conductance mechanosensitive channel